MNILVKRADYLGGHGYMAGLIEDDHDARGLI